MKAFKAKIRAWKRIGVVILALGMLTVGLLTGCSGQNDAKTAPGNEQPPANSSPQQAPVKLTLYFADSQVEKLVAEEREVENKGEPLAETVVKELIKGPSKEGIVKTIPENTRLLALTVADGVANVDFSKEIQTEHWGGSAGELMTVYSVVNSLVGVQGIEKVQFLMEGKKVESLLGHMDLSQPVSPNMDLVKK